MPAGTAAGGTAGLADRRQRRHLRRTGGHLLGPDCLTDLFAAQPDRITAPPAKTTSSVAATAATLGLIVPGDTGPFGGGQRRNR